MLSLYTSAYSTICISCAIARQFNSSCILYFIFLINIWKGNILIHVQFCNCLSFFVANFKIGKMTYYSRNLIHFTIYIHLLILILILKKVFIDKLNRDLIGRITQIVTCTLHWKTWHKLINKTKYALIIIKNDDSFWSKMDLAPFGIKLFILRKQNSVKLYIIDTNWIIL